MKQFFSHIYSFGLISVGISVTTLTAAVIVTSYRGTVEYYQEYKNLKGAVSRAMGGDYQATRTEFIEPPQAQEKASVNLDMSTLNPDDQAEMLAHYQVLTHMGTKTPRRGLR